ncbi:MAG: hypothetical protein ACLS49_10375 [Christensenellales bacterium]
MGQGIAKAFAQTEGFSSSLRYQAGVG